MSAALQGSEDLKESVVAAAAATEGWDHDREPQPRALCLPGHRRTAARAPRARPSRRSRSPHGRARGHAAARRRLRTGCAPGRAGRIGRPSSESEPRNAAGRRSEREPSAENTRLPVWWTPARALQRSRSTRRCRSRPSSGVVPHGRSHLPRRGDRAERLDVPRRLAQPPVLIEVAAHELDRAVVMSVEHGRIRMKDLRPARSQHVHPKGLVLGVVDLAKPDLGPAGAPIAGVDVGEEGALPLALQHRSPSGASSRSTPPAPWRSSDCVRPRKMRPVGGADLRVELERLLYAASHPGHGVASWVRKQISSPEVCCTPRLRVRPCPNCAGSISSSSTPAALTISSERSVEPESITSTSSTPSLPAPRAAPGGIAPRP